MFEAERLIHRNQNKSHPQEGGSQSVIHLMVLDPFQRTLGDCYLVF
jgi:hypothetical protein